MVEPLPPLEPPLLPELVPVPLGEVELPELVPVPLLGWLLVVDGCDPVLAGVLLGTLAVV